MDAAVEGSAVLLESERVLDYPTTPVATEDVQVLMFAVDQLLQRINTATDSELARLRTSTSNALAAAKATMAANAARMPHEPGELRQTGVYRNIYRRERPLVTLGVTLLFAFAIGLCVGRSTRR